MYFGKKSSYSWLFVDLHAADSTFSSFDFLDGNGVDGLSGAGLSGVLRNADDSHSREHGLGS